MISRLPLRSATALTLLFPVLAPTAVAAPQKKLTLEQVSGLGESVNFRGSGPEWSWAPDGVHLVEGRGKEAKWVDPATWERSEPRPEEDDGSRKAEREAVTKALAALDDVDEKLAARIAARRVASADDDAATLYSHDGKLWFHRQGEGARRLLAGSDETELEDLSPDGRWLAYVSGNDLYVAPTAGGPPRAITADGSEETFNGKLDWVYQEELYGRGDFKAFWWSPSSTHVAFLSLDESPVHEFTVIDHIEEGHFRVKPEVSNYPKVGDPNPIVKLGLAEVAGGAITWVDLGQYADAEPLVIYVDWAPDGERMVYQVTDRIQTWLDLNAFELKTGAVKTLLHETSESWVNRLAQPRWLKDGSFLWESERTGWRHLYHYEADGTLIRPVTRGEWALTGIDHLDEERGLLWFSSTRDGAVDRNLYSIRLDGTELTRLTPGRGRHSVSFNGDRSLLLDRFSSLDSPGTVQLCNARGELLKVLGTTEVPELAEYGAGAWELHEVPARDGFPLDVALLKPGNFDPAGSYAVWIPTYSGPDAPSVRNSWNASSWYHFLAQQGVIVMQVNVRTASGKGQWTTAKAYKQLLVPELADLEDAVDWITASPWADAARVGITGYSYGGSMSAYALTHSDKFALGVAGGGVYDWRMYDTIYTERYMQTPQLNLEGYEKTSILAAAKDLQGHLLLYCGVMDDNVHMQNTLQLAYALQKANKPFELMLYPQNRHGIRDRDQRWFARQMEWNAIVEHLGASPAPVPPAPPEAPATTGEAGAPAESGSER